MSEALFTACAVNPLTTNDDCSRWNSTTCYQVVQSVLKISSVSAERVGPEELGGCTRLGGSAWRLCTQLQKRPVLLLSFTNECRKRSFHLAPCMWSGRRPNVGYVSIHNNGGFVPVGCSRHPSYDITAVIYILYMFLCSWDWSIYVHVYHRPRIVCVIPNCEFIVSWSKL